MAELEKARQAKLIGKSLDAKLVWTIGKDSGLPKVTDFNEIWRELFNVSAIKFVDGENWSMAVEHADGQKCERCWHWEMDIGQNAEHSTICGRCVEAVKQILAK